VACGSSIQSFGSTPTMTTECTVCGMADAYTLTNARSRFGELVNRARFGRERVILTEHGTPVAAIISVEELGELQAAMDAADIAAAASVKATEQAGIPHEQVMAALDALDAADRSGSAKLADAILAPHSSVLAHADATSGSSQGR
jgi:prevent-host-death family protein